MTLFKGEAVDGLLVVPIASILRYWSARPTQVLSLVTLSGNASTSNPASNRLLSSAQRGRTGVLIVNTPFPELPNIASTVPNI